MITIQEYAKKVEAFLDMWREEMISDIELVECIHRLEAETFIIQGNDQVGYYSTVPFSRTKPKIQQDGLQDTGHIDAGPYWQG